MKSEDFAYLIFSLQNYYYLSAVKSHRELIVFQSAFKVFMEIFEINKAFPKEELFSLTSQILRSSGSVCANLAETFRKRRYEEALISNGVFNLNHHALSPSTPHNILSAKPGSLI